MSCRRLAAALLLAPGFATASFADDHKPLPIPCEAVDSVGAAKMSGDGLITLRLRSLWPQPAGDRVLTYAPDDPQYQEIKHHLGGLAPGEAKPVPPLCGMNSEP